jgi:hypothetical protein
METGGRITDIIRKIDSTDAERFSGRTKDWGGMEVCIATEVQDHFKFDLKQDLRYIWTVTALAISVAEELCDKRYRALLGGS